MPVMLARSIAFYLVGCPCLVTDSSQDDEEDAKMKATCERLSAIAGDFLGLLGLVLLVVAAGVWVKNPPLDPAVYWWNVLSFFPQTWVYWVLQTAALQFCPSKWVSAALTCGGRARWLRSLIAGMTGIGQWLNERHVVLAMVRESPCRLAWCHGTAHLVDPLMWTGGGAWLFF
jgi:hypothetical protein